MNRAPDRDALCRYHAVDLRYTHILARRSFNMFSARDIIPPSRQPCYFSITPGRTSISSSVETPLYSPEYQNLDTPIAEPGNPLLAIRPAAATASPYRPTNKMDASKLLQLQTQASLQPARARPQPHPVQDVHIVSDSSANSRTSNDSGASSSSSGKSIFTSSMATARCSRCHRTPSLDVTTGKSNMIEYGLNLFYCTRCANIVGFRSR
ncbi:hypothetical protein KVT40_005094 [Elsinoe batatas]|uniref:Uncharacterized protein n=1 Tax=Elsinoe batatas TaxID=2601811 RepID=A0A8K0L0H2_9PEZI|nr:hypothetical protein KVT40_005094 [Elsinoe batatas]